MTYNDKLKELINFIDNNTLIIDKLDYSKFFNHTGINLYKFLEIIHFNKYNSLSNRDINILYIRLIKEKCILLLMNDVQYKFDLKCRKHNKQDIYYITNK